MTSACPRRRLLRLVGGGLALGLAGCSSGPNDTPATPTTTADRTEPTPSPTTATETPNPIRGDLEVVQNRFGDAMEGFRRETDRLDRTAEWVEFRAEAISTDVEEGLAALEEAAGQARPAQEPGIEALRSLGEWLGLLAAALGEYDDGIRSLETAQTYRDADQFDEAIANVEDARTSLESSETTVADAREVFGTIDVDALTTLGDVDVEGARDRLRGLDERAGTLAEFAASMRDFAGAAEPYLRGLPRYRTGKTLGDEGDYAEAIEELDAAVDAFESANEASREGEGDAPNDLLELFLNLTCASGHYREAAARMREAAVSARAGEPDAARSAYDEGLAAEDEAEACG